MAQLKDTTVSGSLRATDTIYTTKLQTGILYAPTSSNGTTYGSGSANNILISNGTSVYWSATAPKATGDKNGNDIAETYLKLSGGNMTGTIYGNTSAELGSVTKPFHALFLGGTTSATMTAASTNPRITFCEGTGTQPVHILYCDYDNYRSPAGLKIVGDSSKSSSPAWLQVEGTVYAAGFNGNATTATEFSSNATVTLTGDTTGTSAGSKKSWSVDTTTNQLSFKNGRIASANLDISTIHSKMVLTLASSSMITQKPPMGDGYIVTYGWDNSFWGAQQAISHTKTPHMAIRGTNGVSTNDWGDWIYLLDENNYTDYTVTKTGTGATGNWEISITGNAATATTAGALTNKTLNSTTIHNTAGSFTFQGSGEPWAGTDWIGLQVGSNVDKFQIRAINGATLGYRQNDSGGTNTSWGGWYSLLSSGNYTDYTVTKTGEGANGTWGIDITGNANTSKYLLNRGTNAISIVDSGWNVNKVQTGYTMQEKVWHQAWKQSGLTYTPSGGSATAITDSGNLLLYLSSSPTVNDVSLNMAIDGIVYAVGGFVGNGGTMTNHITMTPTSTGGEPIIKYKTLRNAESYKGGWAYAPVLFLDAEDNYFAQIGVHGTSSTFNYMYLGAGVWNDELNFRIYPNGDVKATNYLGTWGGNTISVNKGGTGATTGKDAANYFLNSLDTGASTPVDADYYISQYVSGGTTTTTYHRRPMSALWTYVKGKTDTLYVPYSLFDPRASYGTTIASNSNLDADCNAVGTYRSDQASTSQSLTGTVPVTSSGFKIFSIGGYGTKQRQQFLVHNSATDIMYRGSTNMGDSSTWSKWYKIVSLPSGSDNKTFSAVGSSTQPVYVNANGQVIACTSYANASVASAKYLMNRGSNAVSINDSTWGVSIISQGHTIRDKVWHQQWKQSGLKFTPQGGSESNITDSADLVYYLSSSNTANSLTLNMAIDGIVYAGLGFKGVWNGNTISIAKGGTGQTTAKNAINALLNGLDTWTADPTDDTYFIRQDTNGAANYGKVKFSTIWNYIKTKTNTSFNPGSLTITIDTTDKKKALIKFTAPSFS